IRNHGILRHDDDAVADEVRAAGSIGLGHATIIQQPRVLSDARILVDDGALDDSSLTYPDARHATTEIATHVLKRLVVISTHHERRIDLDALRDAAAQTNHGVHDLRAVDDAPVANDRIVD